VNARFPSPVLSIDTLSVLFCSGFDLIILRFRHFLLFFGTHAFKAHR
jgi:hypothetical protein